MEEVDLSRIQFAANITFHILFPSINIGLAWFLYYFKHQYTKTGDSKWLDSYRLWVKIFALCFALGVVSGITMSFQFGTNWPGFMLAVGNIAGPLLAYEVLAAFFLEATWLGIMLYGFGRVSNRIHNIATFLVAFGTTLSLFWIIVLNSWMHTPAGFDFIEGKAIPNSWYDIIFNPSVSYRLAHMILASGITSAFFIAGISAYRFLRGDNSASCLAAMKTAIFAAAIMLPIQAYVGDGHGRNVFKYQPAKLAGIEAIWETSKGVELLLFALPDQTEKKNYFEIGVPKLASLLITHSWDGEIKGLKSFKDIPPVAPLFFGFRIMVGVFFLMFFAAITATWQLLRNGTLNKLMAKFLVVMTFSGWVATVAGWYITEIGRQPWLVYGVLRTADAAAKNVSSEMLLSSLVMYIGTYIVLILSFISAVYYFARHADSKGKEVKDIVNQIEKTVPDKKTDSKKTASGKKK
jgi:cytochrome d ubiquinol oxidase subunit I